MNQNNFLEILHNLANNLFSKDELAEMSEQLMKAFLDFGAETPGNVNCFQNIEYGLVKSRIGGIRRDEVGLKLKGINWLVSEVIHPVGDMEIPAEVKECYPDLTTHQWDAVNRMATMVLLSLEVCVKPQRWKANISKNNFREILCNLAQNSFSKDEYIEMSKRLMQAFLDFGSETPDNVNCFQNIEYGAVKGKERGVRHKVGLKLIGKNVLISEIMHVVEDMEIPAEVKEYYPDLLTNEWKAVARMTTMVLFSLERPVK